jgi:hypothetical protein
MKRVLFKWVEYYLQDSETFYCVRAVWICLVCFPATTNEDSLIGKQGS